MLRQVVRRTGGAALRAARRRLLSERERAIEDWIASGRERLRLEYDLGDDALVVDAGGYLGQWASDVVARFLCRVHVYEPVPEFAARIEARFARNPLVTVRAAGLAGEARDAPMHLRGTGSSVFAGDGGEPQVTVRLLRAADAFGEAGIERIDLIKINIEGGEYELLEHLLETGWIPRIRHIQVQFHDIGPGSVDRMAAVRGRLARTHELSWRQELVWESWKRRE